MSRQKGMGRRALARAAARVLERYAIRGVLAALDGVTIEESIIFNLKTFVVSCALATRRRRRLYWNSSYVQVETGYYAPPNVFLKFELSDPMSSIKTDIAALVIFLTTNNMSGRRRLGR